MECKYLNEQDVIRISEEYYKNDRKKLKHIINNVLRKFGVPQAAMWRTSFQLKRGRVKRSTDFPRRKGM